MFESHIYYECQHVRLSGKKYRAIAIRGHRFCYFHLQARRGQYSSITPTNTVANGAIAPAPPQATTISLPMLEAAAPPRSHSAKSSALLPQIRLTLIAAGSCFPACAWPLPTALARTNSLIPSQVHELELTPEGEQVAPAIEAD